jgi:hypothetical protein
MSMRCFGAAALLCASAFAFPAAAGPTAYEIFPLEQGNLWVFATDSEGYLVGPTGISVIEVTDEVYLGGDWYANQVEGLLDHPDWFYDHTMASEMWIYDEGWSHLFDFDAEIGDSWSAWGGPCSSYDVTMAATSGTATTPAGDFAGVIDFTLSRQTDPAVRCGNPGLHNLRFAPGIGPVDWANDAQKGHLLYARLDDNVVAAGPHETRTEGTLETTFVVTTDTPENPHPIFCITMPCDQPIAQLGFALVVSNTGTEPQTLSFSDSQRFEVDLFDGEGIHINSWSDGRMFLMALGEVHIAAGTSEVFHGTMPLGRGAQPLGDHRLVAYMVDEGGAPKLTVDVDIQPAR